MVVLVSTSNREATVRPSSWIGKARCGLRPLLLGPNAELVTARIGEVESPAAGERVRLAEDLAAGRAHGRDALLEVLRVENHERALRSKVIRLVDAADLPRPALDTGVLGTVVVELPPESGPIETLRCSQIADRELDVIDRMMSAHWA